MSTTLVITRSTVGTTSPVPTLDIVAVGRRYGLESTELRTPIGPTTTTLMVRVTFIARLTTTAIQATSSGVAVDVTRTLRIQVLLPPGWWTIPRLVVSCHDGSGSSQVSCSDHVLATHDRVSKTVGNVAELGEVTCAENTTCPTLSALFTPATTAGSVSVVVNTTVCLLEECVSSTSRVVVERYAVVDRLRWITWTAEGWNLSEPRLVVLAPWGLDPSLDKGDSECFQSG